MRRSPARGFSLLEMAMALSIIAVLVVAASAALRPSADRASAAAARQFQDRVRQALVNFAETHHRLPCPDADADGSEDCDGTGLRTGGVPYYTLDMVIGTDMSGTRNGVENLLYGVHRRQDGQLDADLARRRDRNGDNAEDIDDLRQALRNAAQYYAGEDTDTDEIHVTGDGRDAGPDDCAANAVANMAFVLISPGSRDSDGQGGPHDGSNDTWRRDGSGALCAASPQRPADRDYDDRVLAYSFSDLLGVLERAR